MAINTVTVVKAAVNNGIGNTGCASEGIADSNSPSPPPSPRRRFQTGISQCRRRLRSKVQSHFRRENLTAGILLRWNIRYLLVLPLLYISGLIMCVGPFSALLRPTLPGAVYRSHELFAKLWPDIAADNSSAIELSSVWKFKRRLKVQKPCRNSTARQQHFAANEESAGPNGYLIIEANGGLNQQRSAICNAVALAGLMNAILVIPLFEFNSVRRDPSEFRDIYDEDHFIATLEGHVKVVKELPDEVMERYDYNSSNIPNIRVQAWAPANYYLGEVYPVLKEKVVIRIAPFANRLAISVPPHIQLLRCMANYKALRFSSPISTLAHKLVNRMIEKSSRTGGKYVSIHLRFEEDMVAFLCCVYDGGEAEKLKMDSIREIGWRRKFKRKDRVIIPGLNRIEGKCPLTPLEMFPLLYTKDSLATPDELASFEGGNFPHFLMGQRRFLFDGHAKTIKPDKRKLVVLLQDMEISWKAFKDQMEAMLTESDRQGVVVPRVRKINRKTSVYAYPLPECWCLLSHKSSLKLTRGTSMPDTLPESTR
ncbi:O-fucosyltransferase 11-like isoform X4 [Hevea brasiliensis]|uniref:O-fucosyltransferase 11-like isoform X4 n=1 Tax=Hevea brasiliensis TaxID=3981 RepID=UPI0025F60A3C|nr:O-fucosyltransferase 11-like isoform X4 [Hevea brasiliensis]